MTRKPTLRLGTRGSRLAMTQSEWVARRVRARTGHPVELVSVSTHGDLTPDRPLTEIGGRGIFTREVDEALLAGEVDFAVHSLKDLPTRLVEGLELAAIPERADSRDVVIGPRDAPTSLSSLPEGARVGTGSLRRKALLRALRDDLRVDDIRGNLDTRVQAVDDGRYDAVILAAAGFLRLGWTERIHEYLDPAGWLPAPAQGALAVITRRDDADMRALLGVLDHAPSRAAVGAERAVLHALNAGCQLPVGALGLPYGDGMRLRALVASPDGRRVVRTDDTGTEQAPEALGEAVAARLLEMGAARILDRVDQGRRAEAGEKQEDGSSEPRDREHWTT